ncbi:MAG: chromate efflux transporter [Alcanivoracaceae bacterium]|nr:chromate efflux transporter [Alcanivoracaceae bacterium]
MDQYAKKPAEERSAWRVLFIFLRLGLTSFGGPVAHIGFFRDEFVTRRKWLTDRSYADLVALCQFLPGPASSQVGIAIGLTRSGYGGALAAWAGFTLPSAIALILLALGLASYGEVIAPGVLHGFKIAAVAVVAQAVWGMARKLCPDVPRTLIALAAASFVLWVPAAWAQIAVIVLAGFIGLLLFSPVQSDGHDPLPIGISQRAGGFWLFLFFVLLMGLPLLSALLPSQMLAVFDAFYRSGALVFGGGHVVLPLLQAEVVPTGWVGNDAFLAGYGAAQAVPGPLFTFAAFLGGSMNVAPTGWLGGAVCLIAIFVPSFLLVMGALPFWEGLRRNARVQAALLAINAAVVGLLLAALYNPVWSSAIYAWKDAVLASVALIALTLLKQPPWLVVAGCAVGGWLLSIAL